ncbi:alpha-ketoacid dehydrogenase kinase [Suhomyces tanzawaensis NRRL Y-17324]|uniref:Protein-serine/threonine kinase n=1 Tax=Suhomyces tanzawaensis NRRL Y-17324 TaxID=984487 RepID=A0A1E4SFQ6_9ASCO|nr:alpha-ketoacid dehydrogenase kinase [Suhomyces tanzawaensis NRRL Y-17324]ODV78347.1 alpha-ketoacid dehydrogenase kinase [Suhomyces tanzawaensis NRRL Y-17324]
MGTAWEFTTQLRNKIYQYASYKQTSISLRQMVQFGPNPLPGSIFLASQFIVEELPIRLALKVKDLDNAPLGLNELPSTIKVKSWYAQSFQELTELPKPEISDHLKKLLYSNNLSNGSVKDVADESPLLEETTNLASAESTNPAINNVFSDDGIVVRHSNPRQQSQSSKSRSESPTFGKTYFHPCPTNIVWPKEVYDYNKLVYDALTKIKKRHDATVATMAQGVQEWKNTHKTVQVNSQIQTFLDRFYMSRIGIRMLIGQQVALNMAQASPTKQRISLFLNGSKGNNKSSKSNYVGVVCTDCNVGDIAQDAIDTAKYICEEFYGLFEAPEIQLIAPHDAISFMYVPGHLIHMLFETLKNSLRATIEFHTPRLKAKMMEENPQLKEEDIDINDLEFPPIKVIISEGTEDIAIKISDEGGGIARSEVPLIWTYLYTTVSETPVLEPEYNQTSFKAPMAGFGYGLPISRLYAQYFGGDLKLISMEGYGTDAYLHLNRLSSSSEPLP